MYGIWAKLTSFLEAYLGSCQAFMMGLFAEIDNGLWLHVPKHVSDLVVFIGIFEHIQYISGEHVYIY